ASPLSLECGATDFSTQVTAWLATNGGATASDNCGGTWSHDYVNMDGFTLCSGTGAVTVTFTYADASSNQATTSATFTITDTTPPSFNETPLPQDGTFECDDVPQAANLSADDMCDGEMFVSFAETTNAGTCPNHYQIIRTWTSTDGCGNTASHTQTLTIEDTSAPVFAVQAADETIECDGADHTTEFNTWFSNRGGATATDNCGSVTWTNDYTAMGSFCSGDSVQVVFTATDDCNNSSTTTAVWKVADTTPPVIGVQASNGQAECDGAGNSADVLAWLNNNAGATATDVCGSVTWTNDFTTMALTCGGSSAVSVVFTATDDCGNSATTVATFTLTDTTAPEFNEALPASATVECDAVPTAPTLTATDLCSTTAIVSYVTVSFAGTCPNSYSLQRTWTAVDACNNEVSHVQTLNVVDTTDPLAVGQDVTIQLDGQGTATATASTFDNGSSDACGTVTLSSSLSDETGSISFDCSDLGSQTVTLSVTDECGNESTADVTVTVEDNVNPTITVAAQDEVHECDGTDYSPQLTAWLANNGGASATDACGGIVWTFSPDPATLIETCGDASEVVVTFTATDGSGNSTDTQATFSIEDTTGPVIASDATNVTVECDGLGNTEDLAAWLSSNGGAGLATDACGNVSWSNNFTGLGMTCAGSGAVEVMFTATDDCGNETATTAMFTIEDTTGPVVLVNASDLTVECDGAGNDAALQAWLNDKAGARADDDLCGSTVTWSHDFEGLSDDCGATGSATVVFSATDDCNNSTDFTATFTIQDVTAPQALANDFSTVLDGTGNASVTVEDIDGGSSDVCGEVTMTVSPSSFDCDDIGDQTVTLTVTDECGLTSTATATVTVGAGDAPTITFNTPTGEPEDIVESNDIGECEAVVTWDVPTSADNCSGGTLTSTHNPGDTFAVGSTTTVTYTATDASGTVTTASFTVRVLDTEDPEAITQNLTVQLDASGAAA
ncbi:HYR domain-containing protein, partial [Flavobacteriales bacterium]|nr:HYR domain-containing protein [Flavobacteriales bacterium]